MKLEITGIRQLRDLLLSAQKHLSRIPWLITLNLLAIIALIVLGSYAKIQGKGRGLVSLFSDPFSSHYYYLGWLTGVSEIIWCMAIAVCLFTVTLLPKFHRKKVFFLTSGLLMTLLYIDDRFRLTLIMGAVFSSFNYVKATIYLIYGGLMVAYGKKFWSVIARTPYFPLLAAFVLFGFSSAIDITPLPNKAAHALLEDGTKLIGIINLTIYFWYICYCEITKSIQKGISSSS